MADRLGSFVGKVALITGASSGIGAATAIQFARLGSQLALTGRNEENLKKTAAECEKQDAATKPLLLVGDLMVEADVERIVENTVKHFGRLDILVNNAGCAVNGSILTATLEEFDKVVKINVRSVFHVTKLAVPHLIKTKGSIVIVSSIYSDRPLKNRTIYSMTKGAMDNLTKSLSIDLAQYKVRVNSVNPGLVQTNIQRDMGLSEEMRNKIAADARKVYPLGRIPEPTDVARAIAFLASDDAAIITGVHLRVDGGFNLQAAMSI